MIDCNVERLGVVSAGLWLNGGCDVIERCLCVCGDSARSSNDTAMAASGRGNVMDACYSYRLGRPGPSAIIGIYDPGLALLTIDRNLSSESKTS